MSITTYLASKDEYTYSFTLISIPNVSSFCYQYSILSAIRQDTLLLSSYFKRRNLNVEYVLIMITKGTGINGMQYYTVIFWVISTH